MLANKLNGNMRILSTVGAWSSQARAVRFGLTPATSEILDHTLNTCGLINWKTVNLGLRQTVMLLMDSGYSRATRSFTMRAKTEHEGRRG